MTTSSGGAEGGISEDAFVDMYGDHMVTMGTREMELRTALAMEAAFCTVDETERQDPDTRLAFLAGKIGRESLRPEHHHLLPEPATEN